MARICSVIVNLIKPEDLQLKTSKDGCHQLAIGEDLRLFTENYSLDDFEGIAKRLLELCRIARGKEVLAAEERFLQKHCPHNYLGGYCDLCGAIKDAESVLADEPSPEPDVPITADLVSETLERR